MEGVEASFEHHMTHSQDLFIERDGPRDVADREDQMVDAGEFHGVDVQETVTLPCICEWIVQWYGKVPAVANV